MRFEAELEAEEKGEDLKSNMFVNNPKLFNELYGKEQNMDPEFLGDGEIEFPGSKAEFDAMVASMQRMGVID